MSKYQIKPYFLRKSYTKWNDYPYKTELSTGKRMIFQIPVSNFYAQLAQKESYMKKLLNKEYKFE